jgi:vancomycin resistance protein VanW
MNEIPKPIIRTSFRRKLGREYFILKRRLVWLKSKHWAKVRKSSAFSFLVKEHRSFILRPLKGVDMYLQHNKKKNLEIAINKLDAVVIQPGETLSLWKLVGRPTKSKGYLDGLVLSQGNITKGTGGGLCQLGNLLFWIFSHSPLAIIERHRHGFDVFPDVNRKVPFGAGATLSYNYIDFQVKNNTKISFSLNLWLEEEYLNGKLLSDKEITSTFSVKEVEHQMKQQIWGGYSRHNRIVKVEQKADGSENETLLAENHAVMMYNPFLK